MTGEWKGAGSKSMKWMVIGLAILILGILIIATGDAMMKQMEQPDAAATNEVQTSSPPPNP